MQHATGTFHVSGMKEEPYQELAGDGKLTRASGEQAYQGDIDGTGAVQWLMSYRGDGTAHFVGVWRLTASIDGRSGDVRPRIDRRVRRHGQFRHLVRPRGSR